jgi:hypothetical protein
LSIRADCDCVYGKVARSPIRSLGPEMDGDVHCSLFIVHRSFVIWRYQPQKSPNAHEHWAISGQ